MPEDSNLPEFLPEDPSLPEHKPRSEVVDQFRADIDYWFVRFQNFYDRNNAALRDYRIGHVRLITSVYNRINRLFGDDIQALGELGAELEALIDSRAEEIGGMNDCLNEIRATHAESVDRMSASLRQCAASANATMENNLREVFYLEFAAIQDVVSTVPNSVIDVLSRGNVLEDERMIIEFLRARYEAFDLQWIGGVSRLLGWEASRFENEGLFAVDDAMFCLADLLVAHIIAVAPLQTRARNC